MRRPCPNAFRGRMRPSFEIDRISSLSTSRGSCLPEKWKVENWVSDSRGRRALVDLLSDAGWPRPKLTLDILRIGASLDFAHRATERPSREKLARRAGYSTADYYGKRVKFLFGEPPGRLIERSLEEALELVVDRVQKSSRG